MGAFHVQNRTVGTPQDAQSAPSSDNPPLLPPTSRLFRFTPKRWRFVMVRPSNATLSRANQSYPEARINVAFPTVSLGMNE